MAAWYGDSTHYCLLLLLLLPTLLLAQDDCSHNCKREANRYYYVRPEGSAETLCPTQPCLTPSQLRDHFSECERNNSCQTANTSLVLLPGNFTSASNHGLLIPALKFLSLTGYNEDCNTDSLAAPSIDCNGSWVSLMFQHIKCLHVQNCVVFTGNDTDVEVDRVTFRDSLIRLATTADADHSELDYDYTLGSQSYCLLQKQLANISVFTNTISNSLLALRNVSFSSDYHTACAREYGIQLATIHATDSALDIADCLFTQNAITHISLLHSTLRTSGMVQFENANTALIVSNSSIALAGAVYFSNNNNPAIHAVATTGTHSTILLSGTVEFTNNTAHSGSGGAVSLVGGSMTIAENASVVFQSNHGGAIYSNQHVTIAGSVQFINNSAIQGGAIDVNGNVTIVNNAQVVFQGNHAESTGGAIVSSQYVTIAGSVRFINNSAYNGGAIASIGRVTIADNAQVHFQGNHAIKLGGAIASNQHVTVAGSVQLINNSAYVGGAIVSNGNVTIVDNAQVFFQSNHAKSAGGAIHSRQHATIAGSVQFINNSASQGGAINSDDNVTIVDNAQVFFQGNNAKTHGGAIGSNQHVTIAGSVQFINNSAIQGGAIHSDCMTTAETAQMVFQNNTAKTIGGAIASNHLVTIAGSVQFINNSAIQGGAIDSDSSVTTADNAHVVFQGNRAETIGGAIDSSHVTIAGSVQFINNSASQGGAISSIGGNATIADNAQVIFQGNHAIQFGGAIYSSQHVTIAGSVQLINNSAYQGGAIDANSNVTIADNAQVVFQSNHVKQDGGAISSGQHVTVAGSVQFINNSANHGGSIRSDATMTIANNAQVVFQGNSAESIGGAISSGQHVTIAGSVQFIDNNSYERGVTASAGDVTINNSVSQGNNAKNVDGANASIQYVTSVQFINNSASQAGAIHCDGSITITDNTQVLFQGNHAITGGSIVFGATTTDDYLTIAGLVQFINNSALLGGAILSNENVIIADNAQVVFQGNHADSAGGAILIKSSNVTLGGSVQFISNTAPLGGAIAMFPGNMLTVASNAQVVFQGNHAYYVGGAIYSSASASLSLYVPQYQFIFKNVCLIKFGINSKMELLHNTAERGGSAMYGITMSPDCEFQINNQDPEYEYLFDVITINPDSLSAVSSDPLRVCVCPDQSTPDCLAILPDQNIPHLHYTVYPGQNFTIPVAVVGFNFALTSGSVYAQFRSSDASLGSDSQYVQGVSQTGCSQLQYSVLSDKKQETLVLTTDGRQITDIDSSTEEAIRKQNANQFAWHVYNLPNPQKYYRNSTFITNLTDSVFRLAGYVQQAIQTTPVYVSFQMLDCPPGFRLTDEQRCDCNERILLNHLTCNIIDQTVRRHGNIWVNATFSGNTSNGVIVHKHCPFEYCKPEQLDVNLTHPETQCAFDRFGTLCGACKPNFSLALGGSQCLPNCSNKYLLLLIVFILAGFALVFFIKILNLTVSQGTINGLIFYANIIAANRSIFFPAQHNNFLSFLSVFISWLNLDLGIETCFIKGLDGYWKTWLQFVFPFYVWLIAAAIILASHYSTRATKIFGDKSVSVLATLFLLSYAKLLRSIIIIFSFTTLQYPDNVKGSVWSFDGNLQYFGVKHIPLFLFALGTLLLLWLPYTAVLLSAQWLRTQTHRKRLRWLKPLLDAYYGPFKDKHHYWVGVLLVVRGVLFVFFASFIAIENNVNLLLISITSVSIPIYTSFTKRLYRKMYVTVLENLLFLNLAVLGIGTFYIRLVGGSQEALVTTSVGIAFLEFCGITILHSYQFVIIPIRQWYVKVRANDRCIHNAVHLQPLLNSDSSSDDDSVDYMPRNEVTHSEICLSQLREEQDPPNPIISAEHQLPPADRINPTHSEEIRIPFNRDTPLHNTSQVNYSGQIETNCRVDINENMAQSLIPFTRNTPGTNNYPTNLTDAAANETAGAPSQSEAAAVSLDQPPSPPPPQESSEPPRYFAAEREECFIDFSAARETLLEYTQYRLPHERNEPARDSTAERELLSAPHDHPQESSGPRYFAAEREGPIDFTAPRESLLDYTQ